MHEWVRERGMNMNDGLMSHLFYLTHIFLWYFSPALCKAWLSITRNTIQLQQGNIFCSWELCSVFIYSTLLLFVTQQTSSNFLMLTGYTIAVYLLWKLETFLIILLLQLRGQKNQTFYKYRVLQTCSHPTLTSLQILKSALWWARINPALNSPQVWTSSEARTPSY